MSTVPQGQLFSSVASFIALGFGTGLSPKAPGTAGTLLGLLLFYLMPDNSVSYAIVLFGLFLLGVWCCERCAQSLGVHDHPAIVWDEVVGYLLVMLTLPGSLFWLIAAFLIFRFFDIVKPWPISWIDRAVQGGFGIMLDDVLAAVFSIVVLQAVLWLVL